MYFSISQSKSQEKYLILKQKIISDFCKEQSIKYTVDNRRDKSNRQDICYFYTYSLPIFNEYNLYSTTDLVNRLNINSLLIWILDDGNLYQGKYYRLSMKRFSIDDLNYIINHIFPKKFNLFPKIEWRNKLNSIHQGIRFSREESKKLSSLLKDSEFYDIAEQSMSYKLINKK